MNTSKCQLCNHPIKRSYSWNGQTLGIECWKKVALPEIAKMREAKRQAVEQSQWNRDYALTEAIKSKDFSKIRNEFKVKFLKSLVTQFEEKGFISSKQREMAFGSHTYRNGFYDNGMLNLSDRKNINILLCELEPELKEYFLKSGLL